MKKFSKLFFSLLSVALIVLGLVGCFSDDDTATTITFRDFPKTEFVVGETGIDPLLTVDVKGKSSFTVTFSVDAKGEVVKTANPSDDTIKGYLNGIILNDFDLSTPGTRSLYVTFGEASTSHFTYRVVAESEFAGGEGTEVNPYKIETADQFVAMTKAEYVGKFFSLEKDIDFTGKNTQKTGYATAFAGAFNANLDGKGHQLQNVEGNLFASIRGGKISNLSVVLVNGAIAYALSGKVTLENITTEGSRISGNNAAFYALYLGITEQHSYGDTTNVTMTNCDNKGKIVGYDSKVAVYFAGVFLDKVEKVTMKDCDNEGHLQSIQTGFFCTYIDHDTNIDKLDTIVTFENCTNKNKLVSAIKANDVVASKSEGKFNVGSEFESTTLSEFGTIAKSNGNLVLTSENKEVTKVVVSIIVPVEKPDGTTNYLIVQSQELAFTSGMTVAKESYELSTAFAEAKDLDVNFVADDLFKVTADTIYFSGSLHGYTDWTVQNVGAFNVVVFGLNAKGEAIASAYLASGVKVVR